MQKVQGKRVRPAAGQMGRNSLRQTGSKIDFAPAPLSSTAVDVEDAHLADARLITDDAPNSARSSTPYLPVIELHGVRLHSVTESQTIERVLRGLDAGRGGVVMTPNLDHLRRCVRDLSFCAMLDEADLVIADGMPLVWASRLQGTPLPQRVAGSDLISTLSGAAAERGRSVFLLGGMPGTAQAAAAVLKRQYPTLNVTGHHCPPVGFENDHAEMAAMIAALAKAQPDIVYVALGSPKQERLIAMLRLVLPGAWWLGVGMSFSFLAGDVRRAPPWMRQAGLEWIHRLGQEPRRLFKRYIFFGIPFAGKLLAESAGRGVMRRLRGEPASAFTEFAPARLAPPQVKPAPSFQPPRTRTSNNNPLAPLSLRRLRAVMLLAGSERADPMTTASGRSVLDLPLETNRSILDSWIDQTRRAAEAIGLERLPIRVLLSRCSVAPRISRDIEPLVTVDRDLSDYRGDGGLLANLADDYEPDDLILVAGAGQILSQELAKTAVHLCRAGGSVNLATNSDHSPCNMMLISGVALRKTAEAASLIPPARTVDIRNDLLPALAAEQEVRVYRADPPAALPVRTLDEFILALRQIRAGGDANPLDPLAEDWQTSFSIIEPGAQVDPAAVMHDAVILAGGRVEAGAIVVRSLVCSGGVVRKEPRAMDEIVRPAAGKD